MKKWIEKWFGTKSEDDLNSENMTITQSKDIDYAQKQVEDFSTFEDEIEVIIVSDNHEAKEGLASILEEHPDADHYFHCGDSNLDSSMDIMQRFITVKGNTDYTFDYKDKERLALASGDYVLVTHGHLYSVNRGTRGLVEMENFSMFEAMYRKQKPAKTTIIMYGHTHIVDVKMEEKVLVINPGSVALPRGGSSTRTYARLVITPAFYDVEIKNARDHSIVQTFQFPRELHQLDQAQG